ncbi:MAG: DUF2271 domain-containing protein [Planctomycetes bacterium]|nr:DUF2271 domain-containing protein [Planctomycetota bacterium]
MPLSRHAVSGALSVSLLAALAAAQHPLVHHLHREDVLGTSAALVVEARDEHDTAAVARVEQAVFDEVARLDDVLSAWRDDSEFAQWAAHGGGAVSPDLAAVLHLALDWRGRTDGAYEPGVASLTALWQDAAKNGGEPAAAALQEACATLREAPFAFDGGKATPRGPCTLDGVAKGFVVDRAFAAGVAAGGDAAKVLSFQIGGDVRIGGGVRDVRVTDPRAPSANGAPLCTLQLRDRAIASSGGYERGFDVGGTHHSHILDPRNGRPCDAVLGATVVAADVATADVLATTLCVLGAEHGLALLASIDGAEGVVVTADGEAHRSKGFDALQVPGVEGFAQHAPWRDGFALQVDFVIRAPAQDGGRRRGGWKRPYVAVWIEDLTGAPARTLCVWLENRRWLRDLRRWSRQYADDDYVLDAVSQATRKAGAYTLSWDGTDDEGRKLAPGRYTVLIEAVREHGSYQLMKQEITLGGDAVTVELQGNEEVEGATLRFGRAPQQGER